MQSIDFIVAATTCSKPRRSRRTARCRAWPADALLVEGHSLRFSPPITSPMQCSATVEILAIVSGAAGFGIIPVWGFGEVHRLETSGHCRGRTPVRLFPDGDASRHRSLRRDQARASRRRSHRQGVAPVYSAYARISGDPAFAGRQGDHQALLRPLFMLSFWLTTIWPKMASLARAA